MKASQFNSFFPYEDKVVGYNALSDQFIVLDPMVHSLLEAAVSERNIDGLDSYHPEFYAFLIKKKFLVENEFNELEVVKNIREQVDIDGSTYTMVVNPTMNCNFKCWYCYESHIKDSKMSNDMIEKIIKFSDNLIREKAYSSFHLSWFGGEPLLYFKDVVKPLIGALHSKFAQAGIHFASSFTTNGLLIDQEMVSFCTQHDAIFFQITLDGDEERHDLVRFISKNKGSYKQILNNISLLAENDCQVTVRINISENTLQGLENIAADFKAFSPKAIANIVFSFQKVWQVTANIHSEIEDNIQTFRDMGYKVEYIGGRADTLRNSCYADKKGQATINYNGDVFKCTARDFSDANKEGVLNDNGELVWNEKRDQRLQAKFKNTPCLSCKILPICNGGCSQNALESLGEDYCVFDFDEKKKDEVIYHKFLEKVIYA